jgi:hypothetical protein
MKFFSDPCYNIYSKCIEVYFLLYRDYYTKYHTVAPYEKSMRSLVVFRLSRPVPSWRKSSSLIAQSLFSLPFADQIRLSRYQLTHLKPYSGCNLYIYKILYPSFSNFYLS